MSPAAQRSGAPRALISARFSRRLGVLGLAGLAVLAAAYWLTVEPAPRIRVLWRDGITAQQLVALEAKYFLRDGRDRLPEGSLAYDLLDTSRLMLDRKSTRLNSTHYLISYSLFFL